jgi:DNA-binding NarL/FixJ family response regulator
MIMCLSVMVIVKHPVLREALSLAIDSEPKLVTLHAPAFRPEALEYAFQHQPNIILFSLERNDEEGLQTIAILHQKLPKIPILALTHAGSPQQNEKALACGAQTALENTLSRARLIRELLILSTLNQPLSLSGDLK